MWDLIVSVPDHCLSFYFPIEEYSSYVKQLSDISKIVIYKKLTLSALMCRLI